MRIELQIEPVQEDEEVIFPDYPGAWYPREYVRDTWMQNRRHGTFPREGGFNAQDKKWWFDIQWVNARYNAWFEWWLREKKQREKTGEKDLPSDLTQTFGSVWDARDVIGE